jgi:hypothetical protein
MAGADVNDSLGMRIDHFGLVGKDELWFAIGAGRFAIGETPAMEGSRKTNYSFAKKIKAQFALN